MAAEFKFEIDEDQPLLIEEAGQGRIDLLRVIDQAVDLLLRCPTQGQDMGDRDQRIAKGIVLVGKLDDRLFQEDPLFQTVPFCHGPGHPVPDDHLQREDLKAFDQHLPLVQPFHEMGFDPGRFHLPEQGGGDLVVDDPLIDDRSLLLIVEGRGIILEILDHPVGILCFIKDLGLPFVEFCALFHTMLLGGGPVSSGPAHYFFFPPIQRPAERSSPHGGDRIAGRSTLRSLLHRDVCGSPRRPGEGP